MDRSILLFTLLFTGCLSSSCKDNSPPTFSPSHQVQGTLYIPYAEIKEPFTAWYLRGESRIDYYGDMVKSYQLTNKGQYGATVKLVYVTNEEVVNQLQCLQVNGTQDNPISTQSVIPDLTGFECSGTESEGGLELEKWRRVDVYGDKVSKYTMWIRWKSSTLAVPVKYEMRGYNSLLGSHYDHYYLQYSSFDPNPPSEDVFALPKGMKCTGFPGPGIDHVYTFNPMGEYVGGSDGHVEDTWSKFKEDHGKRYKDGEEHERRKEVFRQNMRFIHSRNRATLGFTLSVNHLADRSDIELRALRGRRYSGGYNGGLPFSYNNNTDSPPDQLDWRLYGAVTPVKDQSVCGSCWSFGTTGTVEGANFIKTGKLLRLSQQALIDCSWGYGNNGCDGGEDFRAYQWAIKHGGFPTEADYGDYLGQDGKCHLDTVKKEAKITGYVNVTSGDEQALRVALFRHGPISVAIDAASKTFAFYSNGIYYNPNCKNKIDELDHAVLAVGYGELNGHKYWLVKNSWSNYWGNDGYVLMSSKDNNCGVMTSPTYVMIA